MVEKNKILIPIAIVVAGILISGTLFYLNKIKTPSGEFLSPQEAAQKAIKFINDNKDFFNIEGLDASLINVVEENGIYKFRLKIGENEYDSYVTKNGKLLFVQGIDLTIKQEDQEEPTGEIPKREKPDVKLFVMSYCPYGLQAQKMFLPVYDLLKGKIEMGVYFVNYIMHEKQEIDENLRQYCIQKEEKEKYYDYLSCFVINGDFEKCLVSARINQAKLQNCISDADKEFSITSKYNDRDTWLNGRYPAFDVHADLCQKYGVRGSPTIVINDAVLVTNQRQCPQRGINCVVISDFTRSPEKFKEVICQAFTSSPQECSQTLSDQAFSPGFGLETGSGSGGQCK